MGNNRIDAVAIAEGVFEALEDDGSRAFAEELALGCGVGGVLAEGGAQIAGEIDRADEGDVDFVSLQGMHADFKSVEGGSFFAGDGEAGAAGT